MSWLDRYEGYGSLSQRDSELGKEETREKNPSSSLINSLCLVIVASSILVSSIIGVSIAKSRSTSYSISQDVSHSAKASSGFSFTLYRENYTPLDHFDPADTIGYPFLKAHRAVIEPYRSMKLHVYGVEGSELSQYDYSVCPSAESQAEGRVKRHASRPKNNKFAPRQSDNECQSGVGGGQDSGVLFHCAAYTAYTLTVTNRQTGETVTGSALCLYVRREMRTLTPEDLDGFVEALYVLYSTPNEEGKALYGNDFENASLIMKHHYYNSAQLDNDHMHEGNAFIIQHVKVNSYVDSSVLLVDPRESLPYWDYTIDNTYQTLRHDLSPMLQEATFGSHRIVNNYYTGYSYTAGDLIIEARIGNSRWKDYKQMDNVYPTLTAGYGYMRSPWDMNPSPYISRFLSTLSNITLPGCKSIHSLLQYTDMMDFAYVFALEHGSTHSVLGGMMGCDELLPLYDKGYLSSLSDVAMLCSVWDFVMKELYRSRIILPQRCDLTKEEDGSIDYNNQRCGFHCPVDAVAYDPDSKHLHNRVVDIDGNFTAVYQEFICGGGAARIFGGDQIQSSSTADPSFWSIHPTIEKVYHAKLSVGGFDNETWATDPLDDFVCGRGYCYNVTTGIFGAHPECCYGHYEHDRLYDGIAGRRDAYTGESNAETFRKSDPRLGSGGDADSASYSLPYIYDSFVFPHCDDSGYNITGLLQDYAADYQEDLAMDLEEKKRDEKKTTKKSPSSSSSQSQSQQMKRSKRNAAIMTEHQRLHREAMEQQLQSNKRKAQQIMDKQQQQKQVK